MSSLPRDGSQDFPAMQHAPAVQNSLLATDPLRNHSAATKLAVMRIAIKNGDRVNDVDCHPHIGNNEGRPLDACLNLSHMSKGIDVTENLPIIELLLQHGADPRLKSRSMSSTPHSTARFYAEQAPALTEKAAKFWNRVVELFHELIKIFERQEAESMDTEALEEVAVNKAATP
ncbi:hypothetical protein BU23DRAFT_649875 [Bimuria novae-zelandiae CBS 107.79]|uniref:Ankyrin n=1 Tax=Bimuria novae-zelandiae CBS 107.79 TaxID=1447943 RepID=A0A6A5V2T8_9PLEO|nr:hypothetical protein BU23DRAFT_649875 [Bimuria novae-zelandiae CBS 107.79]